MSHHGALGGGGQLGDVLLEVLPVLVEPLVELHLEVGRAAEHAAHPIGRESAHEPQVPERAAERGPDLGETRRRALDPVEADEQAQHLVGPLEDPVDARVAQHPFVRVGLHEAASAPHLHHLVGGAPDHVAAVHLRDRRLERGVGVAAVHLRGEGAEHRVGGVAVGGDGGELALRDLELRDGAPELHPPLGEGRHLTQHVLGGAGAPRGQGEAAAVQHVHRD